VLRGPETRPRQPGRLYAFSSGNLYAAGFAGVALGTACGTLARDKVPQGSRRALRESQVVQSQVAQAEARLGSARMFLLSSLGEIW
jgi:hypothetical protein